MALITHSQLINAPIGSVFEAIVAGGDFAAWNPTVRASRRLDAGEIGDGTRFEWDLRGFGKVEQELQEFDRPHQVRIVPHIKQLAGGHRFRLTAQGNATRVNHELEMRPKGPFVLLTQ
ncbi:MAG: SRPBCC family protein [Solirubrobacterales bacterium]|nr:SRPBCC family protein [Solirubrobacterales bacterium]